MSSAREFDDKVRKKLKGIAEFFSKPKAKTEWWEQPLPPTATKEEQAERIKNLERMVKKEPLRIRSMQTLSIGMVILNLFIGGAAFMNVKSGRYNDIAVLVYFVPSTFIYWNYVMLLRWRVKEAYERS